jgi:hypothetical protein
MMPPWKKYPEIPPGSIGWRMGYGEDYWDEFDAWFTRLNAAQRQRYAEENAEPSGWEGFYRRKASANRPT